MKQIIFAAVYVGSYEMEIKIYELAKQTDMREIDHIRYRLDLGKDTYDDQIISSETIEEICRVLAGFKDAMAEYQVTDHIAYATSAIREAKNRVHIIDQIRLRTGFCIQVLSNSEQRFLGYKGIAAKEKDFDLIIQKGTAIVDLGGGSTQLSLFDKDSLIATQNVRWGFVRLKEALAKLEAHTTELSQIVYELIDEEFKTYRKLYLKDQKIVNIIAVCDYITCILPVIRKEEDRNYITKEDFMSLYENLSRKNPEQIAELLQIPYENASFVLPSLAVYKRIIEFTGAELIWASEVTLSDGVAYDFAESRKMLVSRHNFEDDILGFARNIGKRYMCNKNHINQMLYLADSLFDSIRKIHGLSKRERLLLEIAVMLHDCGKYISFNNAADCSYNIIMSTEIIGITHLERVMIAHIVRFNTVEFNYYEEQKSSFSQEDYLIVAKLTAMLRLVTALDVSHRQKLNDIRITLKGKTLKIQANTVEDISLETKVTENTAGFFEDIFSVRPILKQKKYL